MGVTINFEGQLKSNADFDQVMKIAKEFAEVNHMAFSYFEETDKLLQRVKEEKDWDYQGLTRGIRIQPDVNSDPLLLEFYRDNYIQEYCKTQFVDVEIHMKIINFLRQIEPHFNELIINDEGEYWETSNVDLLQNRIDDCFRAIDDAKKENDKLSGPFRIADGRIVDLMS